MLEPHGWFSEVSQEHLPTSHISATATWSTVETIITKESWIARRDLAHGIHFLKASRWWWGRTTVLLVMGAALCGLPSAKLEIVNDERSNRFLAAVKSWGIHSFQRAACAFL